MQGPPAVLPDVLDTGLLAVFCGTAVGSYAGRKQAFYAHPGNRFWRTLHETGITPVTIAPGDYRLLLKYRCGLTDVCKTQAGSDESLHPSNFDVAGLRAKIRDFAPMLVAFNGKKAAQVVLGVKSLGYGPQRLKIHGAAVWVLPSTAGAARRFWDVGPWQVLAGALKASSST